VPTGFRGGQLRDAAHDIRTYVRRRDTRAVRRKAAAEKAMK
jgi:hypothetical protein